MGLDHATLAFTVCLAAVIRLGVVTTLYALNRQYKGLSLWLLASVCAAAGFAIMFSREWFSLSSAYSVVQNTLFAAAIGLEYAGTMILFDREPNWRRAGLPVAAMFIGLTLLVLTSDNWSVRSVFVHAILAYLSLLAATAFFHTSWRARSLMSRFMGTVLAGSGLVYVVMGTISAITLLRGAVETGPIPDYEILASLLVEGFLSVGIALFISQRLTAEASTARKHFELLYQMNPEPTIIMDANENITRVNEAFLAMSGFTADEVIGKNGIETLAVDPEEFQPYAETLWRDGHLDEAEVHYKSRGGTPLTVLTSARVLRVDDATYVIAVARDITKSKLLEAELARQARTDALTHLANRRQFMDLAEREIARSQRTGHPVSVAIMDLDGMKEINDTYGHAAGDEVLITVAEVGERAVRSSDLFARFGGDEFVMLLPETGIDAATEVAQRVCDALIAAQSENAVPSDLCRASFGVATITSPGESLDSMLGRADTALYRAKKLGGGRVEVG